MMSLYDSLLEELTDLLAKRDKQIWTYQEADAWPEDFENRFIMRCDTACELGSGKYAVSSFLPTTQRGFVSEDCVELIGPDIADIEAVNSYARLTLVLVDIQDLEEEKWHQVLQNINFEKYKVNPQGFMLRFSSAFHREQISIEKKARQRGLSFKNTGMNFIRRYKMNPYVVHIRQIFITDPSFDFDRLSILAKKGEEITSAMDHIMKGLMTDCSQCDFKSVCDEVEGLRSVHQRQTF